MNTNQNKHTPAPWKIQGQDKNIVTFDEYGSCAELCGRNQQERARLIAAAPETKEVCDLLKDWNDWSSATTYEEVVKELASIIAKAESAIAKAEGRS